MSSQVEDPIEEIEDHETISSREIKNERMRWLILFLSCMAMTGTYYSFDIPAALHQQLKDYMVDNSSTTPFSVYFNLLYSVYSIPNIILPFFGGKIVDSLGAHTSTLLFAALTLVGQILFAFGASAKSWGLMLLGRVVYGLGGESISVATSTLNNEWFQGKELALSFGINLAVSRLGSVMNNWLSPLVANEDGTDVAIWLGVAMNLMSVIMAGSICWLTIRSGSSNSRLQIVDNTPNRQLTEALLENDELGIREENIQSESSSEAHLPEEGVDRDEQDLVCDASTVVANNCGLDDEDTGANQYTSPSCLSHLSSFGIMFWLLSMSCILVYGCVLPFNNIASGILLERNYFKDPPVQCFLEDPNMCSKGNLVTNDNLAIEDDGTPCPLDKNDQPILPSSIRIERNEFNKDISKGWNHDSYIFEKLSENDIDCGDPFWRDSCTSDFCSKQKRATEMSGKVMSIPYFLSATLSPFCGHLVDKIGRRAIISLIASVILIFVHLSLAWSDTSPVIPLIGQGLAYVCYAAVIWPSVPLTVKEESVGAAFGAIVSVQNFGLAVFPMIIAAIYTASNEKYIPNVEYFFCICAILGTLTGIVLNIVDKKKGSILNGTK